MTKVSVTDLKAHLSRYLREVRRGGEVVVLERGVPVARLSALGAASSGRDDERRARLVRAGILRPGRGDASAILAKPALRVPTSLSAALADDRADRL
jgi:antitoxin (DNA-binding transcriptional repressor) of toxin-antitoxin stability system